MDVYITRGLFELLFELAAEEAPNPVTVSLTATPAAEFDDDELDAAVDPETPILSHFYLPEVGKSVNSVFGMDLGRPAGDTSAKFLSHPSGPLGVTKQDDLAGVVLVAVPPWDETSIAAFDRAGNTLELVVVEAEPPVETIGDGESR